MSVIQYSWIWNKTMANSKPVWIAYQDSISKQNKQTKGSDLKQLLMIWYREIRNSKQRTKKMGSLKLIICHEYNWYCPNMPWDHPLWVWRTHQEPHPHRGVTLPLPISTAKSPFPLGGGLRGPSLPKLEFWLACVGLKKVTKAAIELMCITTKL